MKTIGRALLFLFCVFLVLFGLESGQDNPSDCDC